MTDVFNIVKPFKKFDRQVWTLSGGAMINVLGTSMVMTFLAIYMYEQKGISMTLVGLAFFISTICGAAAAYAGGSLSDRHGRKKILITGLMLQVLSYMALSYSIENSVSYAMFVAVMSLNSMIGGIYRPIPDVMIADIVKAGDRLESYGLLRIGANLG